jgi:hypothetical protein
MPEKSRKKKQAGERLGPFYHFLCWCSGARLYLLKKCPTEYNKHLGIGAVVLLTGFLAFLSGAYALYTVFNIVWISVLLGLFWGVFIFFIDWYIVASLRKEEKFYKELLTATPRIILAVLISVVISKPLEMKLFEKEIENQMALINQQNKNEYNKTVNENFSEIRELKKENQRYREEIDKLYKKRQELYDEVIAEAEGRSPTNIVGKGPVYKEKKAEFETIDQEYRNVKERNQKLIDRNNKIISELRKKRNEKLHNQDELFTNKGFLGRIKALNRLSDENDAVRYANWFVILLFVVMESSPMIVKLLSGKGPYDHLLEAADHEKKTRIDEYIHYVDNYFNASIGIDKEWLKKWEEQEYRKIEQENGDLSVSIDDITNDGDENRKT